MIRSNQNDRRDNRMLGALFSITFLAHLAWTAYVSNAKSLAFVEYLREFVSRAYSDVGFEWMGDGAYVVTAALASSFFVNSVRRLLEGVFLGWPRFKEHDRHSLIRASTLLLCYSALMYFAVGFFGEKYSSRPPDVINVCLIAASTYIVGLLVDVFDDVISGIYCTYRGGKV
ncbi:MAG: hypothetical protein ACK4R8_08490 [Thiobacillus sp.]